MAASPKDQQGRTASSPGSVELGADGGGRRPTGQFAVPAAAGGAQAKGPPAAGGAGGAQAKSPPAAGGAGGAQAKGPAAAPGSPGRGAPPPPPPSAPTAVEATRPATLTAVQKELLGSQFASGAEQRKRSSLLGAGAAVAPPAPEPDAPTDYEPDGLTPHPTLAGRDVWKAVMAPIQSREGARSRERLEQVIAQFAVGANPRYAEEAPGRPRGHIFVWDVSRAMGCEIPHFVGARELTLAQTVDWIRHEGPMRGWSRVSDDGIFEAAEAGMLVVALPREVRLKHVAVVAPQPVQARPLLTGAGLARGVMLGARELFGVAACDCFTHP